MDIIIYGRGCHAENLIEMADEEIRVTAITDSFITKKEEGTLFQNVPVILPEKILEIAFDCVVISTVKDNEEIKNQLVSIGVLEDRIVTLGNFYINLYQKYYKNNKLWDFYANCRHRSMNKMLHYFQIYEQFFAKYRNRKIVMVEIGVAEGGSLQMWKKYFGPQATIIGIDIDPQCKEFEEEQVYVEIGSQEDPQFWQSFRNKYPKVDILLDDGGHTMKQQIVTYEEMFPHIQNGGIYLCEDLHTSYWEKYGGALKQSNTYIEYSKNLIDDMNAYYIEGKERNYNTQNIAGIHYYDSMIVIEKRMRKSEPFSVIKNSDIDKKTLK